MKISIVIPCYNSEKSIEELVDRIVSVSVNENYKLQIVLVNDFSKDLTLEKLEVLAEKYNQVEAIDLMFNIGQFRALICGLEHCSGDYIVTMDDDLQHPPEEIPKMLNYLAQNDHLDVILGKPYKKEHSVYRNLGSLLIRFVNKNIFNKPKDLVMSSFRVMNSSLKDTLVSHKTMFPIVGPLILASTKRIENIQIEHKERVYGKSNYNLSKLIKTTFDNIINFSSLPLKLISFIGVIGMLLSVFITLYLIIRYLTGGIGVAGWTSNMLLINFYGGLTLFSIGIIGEYLIRVLQEVNGFPSYKIRKHYK